MTKTILADEKGKDIISLENMLTKDYPDIQISGTANNIIMTADLVDKINPALVFISANMVFHHEFSQYDYFLNKDYEVIFTANTNHYATAAINCSACGYLLKPVREKQLGIAVNNAIIKINNKQESAMNKKLVEKYLKQTSKEDVIGIPTLEGFEFIEINDIIRCEGLQKCTRVITKEKTDIISSYNLGEFRKMLESYGFYSPHKSHLINLKYIRKYHREGSILMINNSYVPVAKRKKAEFLKQVKHL